MRIPHARGTNQLSGYPGGWSVAGSWGGEMAGRSRPRSAQPPHGTPRRTSVSRLPRLPTSPAVTASTLRGECHFSRRVDAQCWIDEESASIVTGQYVDQKSRKVTVDEWCDVWIQGYGSRRVSSIRQANVHLARIRQEFGPLPLVAVQPSMIRNWLARLGSEGLAASYLFALHSRLSQVMREAVLDRKVPANPCSRRTSPGAGKQRAYVATEAQLWALYELAAAKYQPALLLGAERRCRSRTVSLRCSSRCARGGNTPRRRGGRAGRPVADRA